MKTDKFIQGILVSDEDDLFSYSAHKSNRTFSHVVKRLKMIKVNILNFKYVTGNNHNTPINNAIFSKSCVDGDVDEAIADMWNRLHIRQKSSDDS